MTIRTCVAAVVVIGCMGCGGAFATIVGSYDGSAELYNATNFGMVTHTTQSVITVAPIEGEPLIVLVGIDSDCALRAQVSDDDTQITIPTQTCAWSTPTTMELWVYQGEAQLDGDLLSLDLEGTFTRAYPSGSPPLQGRHTLSFSGDRL